MRATADSVMRSHNEDDTSLPPRSMYLPPWHAVVDRVRGVRDLPCWENFSQRACAWSARVRVATWPVLVTKAGISGSYARRERIRGRAHGDTLTVAERSLYSHPHSRSRPHSHPHPHSNIYHLHSRHETRHTWPHELRITRPLRTFRILCRASTHLQGRRSTRSRMGDRCRRCSSPCKSAALSSRIAYGSVSVGASKFAGS